MKINSMFYVSVFFTAVMIFSLPLVVRAQKFSARDQAILDAEQDAEAVFDERLWYFAGCFFNFGGYFVAQTYYAPVPAVALLGHPPEYVAFYTDSSKVREVGTCDQEGPYRAKSKELRSSAAFMGCIHGAVVQACLPVTIALFARQ